MSTKLSAGLLAVILSSYAGLGPAFARPQSSSSNQQGPVLSIHSERQSPVMEESRAMARHGLGLARSGDVKAALPLLHKALAMAESLPDKPPNLIAYRGLIEAYEVTGDTQKALACYRKVMYVAPGQKWLSNLPGDYEMLAKFAAALKRSGAIGESDRIYRKAMEAAPDRVAPYLYAPSDARAPDRKKMAASLHLALADIAEWRGYDSSKTTRGRYLAVRLAEAEASVAAAPNYAPAHLFLGKALGYQARLDARSNRPEKAREGEERALQAYKRAAQLGGGDIKAEVQRAMRSF